LCQRSGKCFFFIAVIFNHSCFLVVNLQLMPGSVSNLVVLKPAAQSGACRGPNVNRLSQGPEAQQAS
ncbi:MAG: hypothetical protein VXZ91_09345, partial [Pseudomonadota bacterium]|nr:hypothetical protein [Pseudomonadota bacterium]